MNWSITLKKWVMLTIFSAAAGAVAYVLAHLGEMGVPAWGIPLAQAILTGLAAAIANAVKHWND